MFKIMKEEARNYLINFAPKFKFQLPNKLFQVLFFPSTLNDWFNLDLNIRNS